MSGKNITCRIMNKLRAVDNFHGAAVQNMPGYVGLVKRAGGRRQISIARMATLGRHINSLMSYSPFQKKKIFYIFGCIYVLGGV